MVEKILNNTTPYGKIRASHEGSLFSSTLKYVLPFSAIDETPAYITGHLILPHKPRTKDSKSICEQKMQFFT